MIDKDISIKTAINVIEGSSNFSIKSIDKFNKCVEHIKDLIFAAFLLYTNNSFSLSTFLSISIIEEVAKAHVGIYIKKSNSYIKNDKLIDHKSKQIIGLNYIISMSDRIDKAIPIEKLEEIFNMAHSGKLKEIREK